MLLLCPLLVQFTTVGKYWLNLIFNLLSLHFKISLLGFVLFPHTLALYMMADSVITFGFPWFSIFSCICSNLKYSALKMEKKGDKWFLLHKIPTFSTWHFQNINQQKSCWSYRILVCYRACPLEGTKTLEWLEKRQTDWENMEASNRKPQTLTFLAWNKS